MAATLLGWVQATALFGPGIDRTMSTHHWGIWKTADESGCDWAEVMNTRQVMQEDGDYIGVLLGKCITTVFYVLQSKSLWKSYLSTFALTACYCLELKKQKQLTKRGRRESSFHSIKLEVRMSGKMWIISKGQSLKCHPIRKKMSMTCLEEINISGAGLKSFIST